MPPLKPRTIEQSIAEFLKTDKLRQAADGTGKNYRRTLDALARTAGRSTLVSKLEAHHLAATIDDLRSPAAAAELAAVGRRKFGRSPRRGRGERSLNIDRSCLREFMKFCRARQYHSGPDPTTELHNARVVRTDGAKRAPLLPGSEDELLRLAGERHPRDRATIAIGMLAGLRASEIALLQWKHIQWDSPDGPYMDYPRPKGAGEFHRIAINPTLEAELRLWWSWYADHHPEMRPEWYVIPARKHGGGSKDGKTSDPMHPGWPIVPNRYVGSLLPSIKPLLAALGIVDLKGKGLHTLRRTFANLLLDHSHDIRIVQQALGHAHQHTTEQYLDLNRQLTATTTVLRGWTPLRQGALPPNVIKLRDRRAGSAG